MLSHPRRPCQRVAAGLGGGHIAVKVAHEVTSLDRERIRIAGLTHRLVEIGTADQVLPADDVVHWNGWSVAHGVVHHHESGGSTVAAAAMEVQPGVAGELRGDS